VPDFLDGAGPALDRHEPAGTSRGVVLMLHGGTQDSYDPVSAGSGSLRRMMFLRRAIAPELLGSGHSVWLLRFGVRGWNAGSGSPSPVADARWALDQVRATHGDDAPVVLLGHSMGGRTAAYVSDDASVTGMVGLAPWLEPNDPVLTQTDRHLVLGHGLRDRITSASYSRRYVEKAAAVATSAEFHALGAAGHYMLYRPGMWRRFALRHTLDLLGR
jgi:pimeloyl-ACP methyl ester carboxylesterase